MAEPESATAGGRDGAPWTVLLIGGASGTGKSTVARQIGRELGIPWYQVDDFRLALQWSEVTLPSKTEALYYFAHIEEKPHIWKAQPEALRDVLIAVGEVMEPAIAAVVENHISQNNPVVIEGDGILPSLLQRNHIRRHVETGDLRMVVLAESSEALLLSNMLARNRGFRNKSKQDIEIEARAKWLFGEWLAVEAARYEVPIIASRPRESTVARVLAARE